MDTFVPSSYTKLPTEQSPLASPRNPHSQAHLWRRQLPLHGLQRQHQTNLGQLTARMARLDKGSPSSTRTMFPFRIFTMPTIYQAVPNWRDAFGGAQWRSFCVYTGTACAWKAVEGYDPSGATPWFFSPQPACVAYTAGWNNLLPPQIVNENYNEMYSPINLGNYLDDGDFDPAYTELVFTAPPNSIAVFWISWDTLEDDGGDVNYWQVAALNDNYYGTFPVLHFGGYTLATTPGGSPGYFGDLNADNAAILAGPGDQVYGGVDNGTPPQYIAFAQQIGSSTYSSDMDEGAVLVGSMVIGETGSEGASVNNPTPSNDGYCQIYQQLFDNVQGQQPRRRVWQGPYDADSIYYPGEIVTESGGEYINATEYAMVGYDPVSNASGSPLIDDVEYGTLKNFWMPVGGGGGISMATVTALEDNYLYATIGSSSVKVALAPLLQRQSYDGKSITMPDGTHAYNYQSPGLRWDNTSILQTNSVIWPPYLAAGAGNGWNTIFVCQPAGGTGVVVSGNAVVYQDITPGRDWKVQVAYCNNGNSSYVVVDGSPANSVFP